MIGPSLMTALYLAGVDAARDMAVWDATHPSVYAASFGAALGVNLLAVAEGVYRLPVQPRRERAPPDPHGGLHRRARRHRLRNQGRSADRRDAGRRCGAAHTRSRCSSCSRRWSCCRPSASAYAVGVSHVLGPRVVLRRSLQYALASKTLTVIAVLPAIALALSLVRGSEPDARRHLHEQRRAVHRADRRVRRGLPLPRARAPVAGPPLLPRGVRRAKDPVVAGQPRPVRDRSGRSRGDGREPDRRSAAPEHGRDPGGRARGRPPGAGDGPARQRRFAAARRRARRDAALVRRTARHPAARSAVAGPSSSTRGTGVAALHRRGAARARRRAGGRPRRGDRARRTPLRGSLHGRGP